MPPYRAKLGGVAGSGVYPVERPTLDAQGILQSIAEAFGATRDSAIRRAYLRHQMEQDRMRNAQAQMDRAEQSARATRAESFAQQQFEEAKRQSAIRQAFEMRKADTQDRQRQEDIFRDDLRAREEHGRKLELETVKAKLRPAPRVGGGQAGAGAVAARPDTRAIDARLRNLNTQIDDTRADVTQARQLADKTPAELLVSGEARTFAEAKSLIATARQRVASLVAKGDSLTGVRDSTEGARVGQPAAAAAPPPVALQPSASPPAAATPTAVQTPPGERPLSPAQLERVRTDPDYRAFKESQGYIFP